MAAVASMYRQESRWGLYHNYVDFPQTNDSEWFCHVQLFKDNNDQMTCSKKPVKPYVVELDEHEKSAYQKMRVQQTN
jgi:succinate dehydrogenase/fumarate reductase flavoprotein subunit